MDESKYSIPNSKLLKKEKLPKIPILINNEIINDNSRRILSKNILNSSRFIKPKLCLKKIKIKEDSKNSQNLMLKQLMKIKIKNSIKNQKFFAHMAKEIAEKNMTHYLSGYYDIFDVENQKNIEQQSDNQDNDDNEENSSNEKNSEILSTIRPNLNKKKVKKIIPRNI